MRSDPTVREVYRAAGLTPRGQFVGKSVWSKIGQVEFYRHVHDAPRLHRGGQDATYELAKRLLVPSPRINDIVPERRGITADTAVRLSRFFRTTEQFWLNLRSVYEVNRVKAERGAELERIEPIKPREARA